MTRSCTVVIQVATREIREPQTGACIRVESYKAKRVLTRARARESKGECFSFTENPLTRASVRSSIKYLSLFYRFAVNFEMTKPHQCVFALSASRV